MLRPQMQLAVGLVIALMFAACTERSSPQRHGFDSPTAAYEATALAVKQKDWRSVAYAISPPGRDELCSSMIMMGQFIVTFKAEGHESLGHVMRKHGVDPVEAAKSVTQPYIPDKVTFLADMMEWMTQHAKDKDAGPPIPEGRLTELKIEGNSATALIEPGSDAMAKHQPIEFIRLSDRWYVHIRRPAPPPVEEVVVAAPIKRATPFFGPDQEPDAFMQDGALHRAVRLTYQVPKGEPFTEEDAVLFVQVALRGEKAQQATAWGNLKLTTARTALGEKLTLITPPGEGGDRTQEVLPPEPGQKSKDVLRFLVRLTQPMRPAESISLLEGSITARTGGDQVPVIINTIQGHGAGDVLEHPMFEEQELKVSVGRRLYGQDLSRTVNVDFDGATYKVYQVDVLDGKGEVIPTTIQSTESGERLRYSLTAEKTLPAEAKLRITLMANQTLEDIPFSFNFVPLPN